MSRAQMQAARAAAHRVGGGLRRAASRPAVAAAALLLAVATRAAAAPAATAAPVPGAESPPAPPALPATLSLAEAEQIFLGRGIDLLLAEAQVRGAAADVAAAGAVNNPQLGGGIGRSFGYVAPQGCTTCSATALNFSVADSSALMDLLSGRRGLRLDAARAALGAARLGRDDARRTLLLALRVQYLQVALDDATLDFARQAGSTFAHTAELFAARYREGAISEADLARVEIAALEAEQAVDTAAEQLRVDRLGLAFLLGERRPVADFAIKRDWLDLGDQESQAGPDPAALTQAALRQRPDLRAQAAQRARAEAALRLAYRLRVPDIALNLGYSGEGTGNQAIQPPTYAVGLTLTLPAFYQFQGEIGRARADLDAQALLYDKAVAQVYLDVGGAAASVATTGTKLTRMRQKLRGRAARALELVELQYHRGAASLLDLLDAERTFIAINQEYIDNLNDFWTATFTLQQATASGGRP